MKGGCHMSDKKGFMGLAALAAAGAGAAMLMKKTVKEFITPTVTTKLLPALRNRKALMINMPIS